MKENLTNLIIVLIVILIFPVSIVIVSNNYLGWQKEQLQIIQSWEKAKFQLELRAKCQEIDATKTSDKLGYKSCVRELDVEKIEVQEL